MKIFLSAIEWSSGKTARELINVHKVKMKYNLMSYFYIRKMGDVAEMVRDNTELILIDSGAHSFQQGRGTKAIDWDKYTEEYAEFIRRFDRDNVIGYFEMDVDNVIGYDKVLELRRKLEDVTDKIIPVWHKNRGIEEYKKMCRDYAGKIVAITGFRNEDIKDEQYLMFVKYAHKFGCKIHCLGMTRKKVLDSVPFDFTDSSSWAQGCTYGRCMGKKVERDFTKNNRTYVECMAYIYDGMAMQKHYELKWRKYN